MIVTISPRVAAARHPEIGRVIELGLWGVNRDEVVVDVRGRAGPTYTGACWTALRLIRLRIPYDPTEEYGEPYPRVHREERLKNAPEVTFEDWREQLLFLVAHEASHLRQHDRPIPSRRGRLGPRQSERIAESWAANVFERISPRLVEVKAPPPPAAARTAPLAEGPDLIDYLVGQQERSGMNDTRFQKLIGLPDLSTWMRYKRRERPPPLRLFQLAVRAWPQEKPTIVDAALASKVRGGVELAATG